MDILNKIIESLDKHEVRTYKIYAKRTIEENERKDLLLFDYIRKTGKNYLEDEIFSQLYKDKNKNSFYRLKNRLLEELNKNIYLHYTGDAIIQIMYLMSLAIIYFKKSDAKIGIHYLKKAEKKALSVENHELLDIIYIEYIKMSKDILSINPEVYIQKRKENKAKIDQLREIDDILTAVNYRLRTSQNFSSSDNSIFNILQDTIAEFSETSTLQQSTKFKLMLYNAVSKILLGTHQYIALEEYLLSTYKNFIKEKVFTKERHDTKLQMLTYIVNVLFKNKKHNESLKYSEILKNAMNEYKRVLYDKYLLFYYNTLVINYSQLEKKKAVDILEECKQNEILLKQPHYEVFIYGNLAVLWFDLEDYDKALDNLVKLYYEDGYKNLDIALKYKFAVAELIIRFELNENEFIDYKIAQIKNEFKSIYKLEAYHKEKEFIAVLNKLNKSVGMLDKQKVNNYILTFLENNKSTENDDSEIIKYNYWLESKLS